MKRDVARILRGAVGGQKAFSTGTGFADCHLLATTVSIGIARCLPSVPGAVFLDQTIAYDTAEVQNMNLGQVNMIAVSSFCGPNGLVLGHDFLCVERESHPLLTSFRGVPVYDLLPLERAAFAMFGTVESPRFPFLPGSFVPCAYKMLSVAGEGVVWGAIAVAIARNRTDNADLIMEELGGGTGLEEMGEAGTTRVVDNLLAAVSKVGENQGVKYEQVYVGFKQMSVPAAHCGCALVAAPYFRLAKAAVVTEDPAELENITLSQWEDEVLAVTSNRPAESALLPQG